MIDAIMVVIAIIALWLFSAYLLSDTFAESEQARYERLMEEARQKRDKEKQFNL